jgi:alanine racemase
MSNGDVDSHFASHPTWMELDAHALHHNLVQIRKRINPEVKVIASVKANGYGHGIIPVCKILQEAGVDMLTTGSFSDAKALRKAGINMSTPASCRILQTGIIPWP